MRACELTEGAILSGAVLQEGGVDLSDEGVEALVVHSGMTLVLGRSMVPCALDALRAAYGRINLNELLGGDPLDRVEQPDYGPDEWDEVAEDQLRGPPFIDLATEFTIRFAALGTSWIVRVEKPDARTLRAAERFAAAAQVLLVELAEEDLCLMPATVDITVDLADPDDETSVANRARCRSSRTGRRWLFPLSPIEEPVSDPGEIAAELLVALTLALMDASLLPFDAFDGALNRAFERGLHHKLIFGRPFDELVMPFEDQELRTAIPEDCVRPEVTAEWMPIQSDELRWITGPGPGFSEEDATANARARCEKTAARFPRQLAMLRNDGNFATVVASLRQREWKDQHILASVMNLTLNKLARMRGIDLRDREKSAELMDEPETADSPLVPASEYTVDAMEEARRWALPAVLKTWGLTLHSPNPDLDAVEQLLAERYAYWSADSDYEGDPLP